MFSVVCVCHSVCLHSVWSPNMFKLVHYIARTSVGKQAVGIRLKCLLVKFNVTHHHDDISRKYSGNITSGSENTSHLNEQQKETCHYSVQNKHDVTVCSPIVIFQTKSIM